MAKKTATKAAGANRKASYPVSKRGHRRKAKILSAATDLFLSGGYGQTSIDAIVEKSGGSKATLYSYYPTKADLFRAVVDSIVTSDEHSELKSLDNVRDTLVQFAIHRMSVVFSRKHRSLMRLIIAEASEFFRGMLLHQRYIDQLYLDRPVPSAEEVAVRSRHVVDRFLEAYHLPEGR